MEIAVVVAVSIAIRPDNLAGGVDAVRRDIDVAADRLGNVDGREGIC